MACEGGELLFDQQSTFSSVGVSQGEEGSVGDVTSLSPVFGHRTHRLIDRVDLLHVFVPVDANQVLRDSTRVTLRGYESRGECPQAKRACSSGGGKDRSARSLQRSLCKRQVCTRVT